MFDEMTVRERGAIKGVGRKNGGQMRFFGNWRRRGGQREGERDAGAK